MVKVTGNPTEKNPSLLSRIISVSSAPGDLVLDCFAGPGTTLAVASESGRGWIGVDNSPGALRHMLRRFAQGRERMGDFVSAKDGAARKRPKQPLSLFESEPEPEGGFPTATAEVCITDFTVWASESEAESARPIIETWAGEAH